MNCNSYLPTVFVHFERIIPAVIFNEVFLNSSLIDGVFDSCVKMKDRHNHWKFWTMSQVYAESDFSYWKRGENPEELPVYCNYDLSLLESNEKYREKIDNCIRLAKSRYFYFENKNMKCYYPWMLISESLFNSNDAINSFMNDMFFKRPEKGTAERIEHFEEILKHLNSVGIYNNDDMIKAHEEIKNIEIEDFEAGAALAEIKLMFENGKILDDK